MDDKNTIDTEISAVDEQPFVNGAKAFKRFIKRPERFKNMEVLLRVRMEGRYGGWKLRDAVFAGFGFTPGDTLYLNDLYVMGDDSIDVDMDEWRVDCFSTGKEADWLEEKKVTTGTEFEGKFRFVYEMVEKGANSRGVLEAVDAKIAKLILIEGVQIIGYNSKLSTESGRENINSVLTSLKKAMLSNDEREQ